MKKKLLFLVSMCVLCTSNAQTVLLETFGPSDGYSTMDKYPVAYSSTAPGQATSSGVAVKFRTPSGANTTQLTVTVATRITVGISFVIAEDDNGLPTGDGIGNVGFTSVASPFSGVKTYNTTSLDLSPDTDYWLMALPPSGDPHSLQGGLYRTNTTTSATVATFSENSACAMCKTTGYPWVLDNSGGNVPAVRITTGTGTTSVSSAQQNDWAQVWFNGDELNISCEEDVFSTSVYSTSGQKLITSNNDKNVATQLIAGSYIVEIIAEDRVYRSLLVK